MARRRPPDPQPTLFPFLSVLAAVMGTLILIIAGQSQLALANPKQRVDIDAFDPAKKNPIYVECRFDGVHIYPEDPLLDSEPKFVARYDMHQADSEWRSLTRRMEFDTSHYILLLVRPDGVGTFNDARASVSTVDIDLGYEPLFGTGDVRFRPKKP
jgi:hypothetical protein